MPKKSQSKSNPKSNPALKRTDPDHLYENPPAMQPYPDLEVQGVRADPAGIYAAFAEKRVAEGADAVQWPAWDKLYQVTRDHYALGVAHVKAGGEPRTEFERFVKEMAL